jgi:hypothetical protein
VAPRSSFRPGTKGAFLFVPGRSQAFCFLEVLFGSIKKPGLLLEVEMAATGLLGIVILVCGGLFAIAAVAVVIYLIMHERE